MPRKEELRPLFGGKRSGVTSVAFGSENSFWIGAGNFAHCDPANAANQRADQKRKCCEWNEGEKPQSQRKRTCQNFADPNKPARAMFVDRSIGHAMFIDTEPDPERGLNSGRVEPKQVERRNSVSQQF